MILLSMSYIMSRFDLSSNSEICGIPAFIGPLWHGKQRKAHSLHEVPYRACFKPELPEYFISSLTSPGNTVYDPFSGRGTTMLQAALQGRKALGCDINPLSEFLVLPRLNPPLYGRILRQLKEINLEGKIGNYPEELLTFYHPKTLEQLIGLRNFLLGNNSEIANWIRMVALTRLTGHSTGYFSVYSLPPNQAASVSSQQRINKRKNQTPSFKNLKPRILDKTSSLLRDCNMGLYGRLRQSLTQHKFFCSSSNNTPYIWDNSVDLVVTSPPFLNIVNYAKDNWLRCWFCDVDADSLDITMSSKVSLWSIEMGKVLKELYRVVKTGGYVAFEVGEVKKGSIKLEEPVIREGKLAGFSPKYVLINDQKFTKTSNIWGIENSKKGTNTNRVVLFQKE